MKARATTVLTSTPATMLITVLAIALGTAVQQVSGRPPP
jgi:hypothetical protein